MELRFFGNTQLVSKEWEIVNLEVVPDHNPELYKMEPRTSTRWGQIATNIPLKNAFGQRWETHKIQISRKWRGPGPPFPRGNSKGDIYIIYILSCKEQCGQPSYLERARCKNLTRYCSVSHGRLLQTKSLHIHSMQLYACTYLVGTKWKPTKTEPTLLQFG